MAENSSENKKALYSFYSAIVFLILASPPVYKLVDKIFGALFKVADSNGCATTAGLFLHAIVFGFVVYGLMHLNI